MYNLDKKKKKKGDFSEVLISVTTYSTWRHWEIYKNFNLNIADGKY